MSGPIERFLLSIIPYLAANIGIGLLIAGAIVLTGYFNLGLYLRLIVGLSAMVAGIACLRYAFRWESR